MKRTTSIENIFRPLAEQSVQSALTNEVQIADILEWVLEQVGTSEVWQTSFSISEEFLRRLYFITRIITSQNLTRGNRNEAYIITTEAAVFDKFLAEVEHLIKWQSKLTFLVAIFNQRKFAPVDFFPCWLHLSNSPHEVFMLFTC